MRPVFITYLILFLVACAGDQSTTAGSDTAMTSVPGDAATAIYAGGCFWCVESDLEKLDGVFEVVSGYTGGTTENPTYKEVSYENTGHREAVQVFFDPTIISYKTLTTLFIRTIDPLDAGGQFCDRGFSYSTAIFTNGADQKATAMNIIAAATEELGQEIVTPLVTATTFYDAEAYHQDYYKKNPVRYKYYRTGCGRDRRVKQVWGKSVN